MIHKVLENMEYSRLEISSLPGLVCCLSLPEDARAEKFLFDWMRRRDILTGNALDMAVVVLLR